MNETKIEDLTTKQIVDVITMALEGASNHWYLIDNVDIHTPKGYIKNNDIKYPFIDKVLQGGTLDIYDVEEQNVNLGSLTMESIKNAVKTLKSEFSYAYYNILAEMYDEEDADIFFQLCIMGEYIY